MKEMRRKKQQLTEEQIEKILRRNTYGILSLCDGEGQPYGVPLNYVYADGNVYFHCAKKGYKTDIIGDGAKASFTVVDSDTLIPETFSTDYVSVIAFGDVFAITDEGEKSRTLWALTDALGINDQKMKENEINGSFAHVEMLCFRPEKITGKAAMAVMKKLSEFDL